MSSLANPASGSNPSLDQVAAQVSRYKRFFAIAIVLWFAVAVTPHWIPTSDGALYLMLGRSVAHGEGYTLFGKPHTFVPPGYPLMIASLERIGLGSMLCLNIAMAILGLLTVWLSYRLVSLLASRQVAWLVAVLVGLNATVHTLSRPTAERYSVHGFSVGRNGLSVGGIARASLDVGNRNVGHRGLLLDSSHGTGSGSRLRGRHDPRTSTRFSAAIGR